MALWLYMLHIARFKKALIFIIIRCFLFDFENEISKIPSMQVMKTVLAESMIEWHFVYCFSMTRRVISLEYNDCSSIS